MTYAEALDEIKSIHPKKMMLSKKEVVEVAKWMSDLIQTA